MSNKKAPGIIKYLPGFIAVLAIAIPSVLLEKLIGARLPVSELFYAIVLGLAIGNIIDLPARYQAGITFAVKRILKWGIILMGIRLSFCELTTGGLQSLLVVVPCIVLALLTVYFIAKKLGLHEKLAILIGVGTAICGNSAIIATAPAIEAEDDHVAFAIATITLFGTIAVFLYPLIGRLFDMSDKLFGIWSGTAINDTSQVIAASGIYSEQAQNFATITKLTRNLFMAPVILGLSLFHIRRQAVDKSKKINYRKTIPWFVLGFVAMALVRTLGDAFQAMSEATMNSIVFYVKKIAGYCIVIAISGVGLKTRFSVMRKVGMKPFLAGLVAAVIMAGISIILIHMFGVHQPLAEECIK